MDWFYSWDTHESNLPDVLVRFLNGQSREIARQCVEPPIRSQPNSPQFQSKTSFEVTLSFLVLATQEFHNEICPVCEQRCLPQNSADVVADDSKDNYVERVYCGHTYHQGCLKKYMREPPFPPNGKTCPAVSKHLRSDMQHIAKQTTCEPSSTSQARTKSQKSQSSTCGIRLSHDRWGLNVKLAEARWAQQQARVRELEEVIDFLQ